MPIYNKFSSIKNSTNLSIGTYFVIELYEYDFKSCLNSYEYTTAHLGTWTVLHGKLNTRQLNDENTANNAP